MGVETSVNCREVVPISEGPLSEVPLYLGKLSEEVNEGAFSKGVSETRVECQSWKF